jgi:hypothetical protein
LSEDILRADPRLRRLTLIVLGIAALLAMLGLTLFHRWLGDISNTITTDALITRVRSLIGLALTGSAICIAALAWYAARTGKRACTTRQWPSTDARVIRDTPIRRGNAALRIGRLLQVAAIVLIALALTTGIVSWRLFRLTA